MVKRFYVFNSLHMVGHRVVYTLLLPCLNHPSLYIPRLHIGCDMDDLCNFISQLLQTQ
jgi:hypothetical protein